jgi:hypothetical protein
MDVLLHGSMKTGNTKYPPPHVLPGRGGGGGCCAALLGVLGSVLTALGVARLARTSVFDNKRHCLHTEAMDVRTWCCCAARPVPFALASLDRGA